MGEVVTVELDTTVIDSADVANIGMMDLGDEIVDVGGKPNAAGTMDRRVRISGTLTIEPAENGEKSETGGRDE